MLIFRILAVSDKFCVVANGVVHFSVCVTSVAHTFCLKEIFTMNQNGTPTNNTYPPVGQQPQVRPVAQQPVQPYNGVNPQYGTPNTYRPAQPYNGVNPQYGAPVPVPQMKKKKSKAKVVIILILVFLLALLIGGAVLFFTSPAYSVRKDMKNEEYTDAVSTYEDEVEDNFVWEFVLDQLLKGYDTTVIEQFKAEKLDYASAKNALEALDTMGFETAIDKLAELEGLQIENTAFESGITYAQNSDYENAIKEFSKIGEDSEQYKDAQTQLDNLYPQYVVYVVDRVNIYTTAKEYDKALTFINTAFDTLPQGEYTEKLKGIKDDCHTAYQTHVTNQVATLLSEEEYEEALETINTAIGVYDNEEFQSKKITIIEKYVNSVTQKVNKYLKKEDYVTAQRVADKAVTVLPGNSALLALQDKVKRQTPTYLLDAHSAYSSSEYTPYVNGELMYMGGKSYTNGFILSEYNQGNAVFNIDGLYDTLRFTVGHVDNTDKNAATIKIYCDGVMKKEIEMNAEDLPRKVTLDVTGVRQLKFEIKIGYLGGSYGFANVTVK